MIAGLASSCGSNNSGVTITVTPSGPLYTYISDSPSCDVLGFRMNIAGLQFRRADDSTLFYTLFPTASVYVSMRFDFAAMRDYSTLMYLTTIPQHSYDRAELTLQLPKIALYDPSVDPPITVLDGNLSTANPSLTLQPNMQVSTTALNVLKFDFDVDKSIQLDTSGKVTKNIIPVFTVTAVPQAADKSYGTFDDLTGFVRTVTPSAVGSFIGTFSMQMLSGTGQAVTVSLRPDTSLAGVASLATMETGRIVEVNATVDSSGNISANQVQVEDRAMVEEQKVAYYGVVLPTPVTDASGNVTQFKLYLRATDPDESANVPLDSVLTVNVTSNTYLQTAPRPNNLTPLVFDATSITVGQELLVHGQYTLVTGQPTVVNASSIYLRPQTLQGGLSSLISVGSDGRSGAFQFAGCSTLLQTTPIIVMTTNVDTAFINLFGLAEISPQAKLFVRGFPYYVKDATVIRGTPVPAGTLVLFATQVRQVL